MSVSKYLSKEQWQLIFQDFLEKKLTAHLKGGQWTYKQHANVWDLNEQTLASKASQDKWGLAVKEHIEKYQDTLIAEQQKSLIINEVEIRNRHISSAKELQSRAIEVLMKDSTKLKPNEAIRMLELAIDMERKAAGIGMMVGVSSEKDTSKPVSVNEVTKSMVDFFETAKGKLKNNDVVEGEIIDGKSTKTK